MILIDLKLALFAVVLVAIAGLAGAWQLAARRSAWRRYGADRLQQTLEVVPFGMVVIDPGDAVVFSNAAARRLLGALGGGSPAALRQVLRRVNDPSQPEAQRSGLIHRPLPVRWWRYPLGERCTLLVLVDAGEQQRLVRQQQAFIGQLAHELRTPLTALVAHTEIARNPQTAEAVRRSSLETIQRETQRMARLVRDLLELHRLETTDDLPLQPTNVVLVAEEAVAQTILRVEERGLGLTFDADVALPLVLAQPDRLKQAFLNLLDNAVKYCRPGDTIAVRLEARPEGVRCVVQDTGPGIAAADLPHVAERLYRGRTEVEGSGIGLALVSEILRRHHASLSIESTTEGPASGTTVSWTLLYATTPPGQSNHTGTQDTKTA